MYFLIILQLTNDVIAQEEGEERGTTFEELGFVPPFRVTAFRDRVDSGDCDPIDARYGRCIEIVDFYEPTPVWIYADQYQDLTNSDRETLLYKYPNFQDWINQDPDEQDDIRRQDKAAMQLMSDLYAQTWEDIVYRWKEDTDQSSLIIQQDGFKVTPDPREQWNHLSIGRQETIAEVNPKMYLKSDDWYQPTLPITSGDQSILQNLSSRPAFFPRVKQAIPKGHFVEPTPSVLLSGRFAYRLGFNNRVHDYNLMDADPYSSGPFFEQIYPYDTIYQQNDETYIPLADFKYPSAELARDPSAVKNIVTISTMEDARQQAVIQFNRFYRLVSTQVMKFAMQDYTANHMRIMGTLTTMRSPPGSLEEASGIARNLNASAQGQTDSSELLNSKIKREEYAVPGGFKLNFEKLPEILIIQWLERLTVAYPPTTEFYMAFADELIESFREILDTSRRATSVNGLSDSDFIKWIEENGLPGVDVNIIVPQMRKLALRRLMSTLSNKDRDVEETWLLLDHFNYEVISNLDSTPGIRVSPSDITGLTSEKWEGVLKDHFYSTQKIDQGLGAIDPTAVCTTKDRLEALSEPTIGAIYVDQIFAGKDNHIFEDMTNEELLWEAKYDLPFLMFDNPDASLPSIERLVGLPDNQALYRARWSVWTGWHLMWGIEQFAGKERLVLKTGALCENMILSPPDLVATLVRGGLLDDQFYPTVPAKYNDMKGRSDYPSAQERQERRRKNQKNKNQIDRDAVLNEIAKKNYTVTDTVDTAKVLSERLENPVLTDLEIERAAEADLAKRGLGFADEKQPRTPVEIETGETVAYFRKIARAPLEELSSNEGLLVIINDLQEPIKIDFLRDGVANTPYIRDQKLAGLQSLQGASWALYFDKDPASTLVTKAAPAYIPRPNYLAGAVVPVWMRNRTTDTTFAADVGLFPKRTSYYKCDQDLNENTLYSVETCDGEKTYTSVTEGLSIGASSYRTEWFRDDPRLAYEVGLEVHLDMLHGGKTWFHGQDDNTIDVISERLSGVPENQLEITPTHVWSFRPQTGASFGIRHSPDPSPLYRPYRSSATWGSMGTSGSTWLGRTEWGVRGAFLLGPSYNGMEGTLVAEGWAAQSFRNPRSDWAYFSPYHPILNGGPFFRFQRGAVLIDAEEERMFNLLYSDTYIIGWRTHFRLPETRPE
jgi:hypothetical protein